MSQVFSRSLPAHTKGILRTTILVCFTSLLCLFAIGQQAPSIQGQVVDPDNRPVFPASLRLDPIGLETMVTEDGRFSFPAIQAGKYTIVASSPRFGSSQTVAVSVPEGQSVSVTVQMTNLGPRNESVVVTGTRTPHLLVEAPVRTDLILAEVATRQVKTNLSELLTSTVSGIRIENNCQNCGFTAIRLNGLEGPYTQILEDGLPSYSGVTSVYGLDQIPTEFLDTVEVVKGGNSALYGPNAVAGVVNLIRREPTLTGVRFDTLSGVEKGRPEHQVGASAQVVNLPGGFGADFYYRGAQRTHIDRDRDGFTEIPRRILNAGGGTAYRRFFDGSARLSFGGNTLSEFRRGGSQFDLRPEDTFVTEQLDATRHAGFMRWNHAISPRTFYSANTTFTYLRRFSYYGADFDPNAYGDTRNPLSASDAQIGHTAGKHTIVGGFQYWWEHVQDVIPAYNRQISQSFSNMGLFVQDEWRMASNVTLVAGVRGDKSNVLDNWVLSPRANIRIGLGQNWNLRFGGSRGFRAPTIFDEDLHIAAVGGEGFVINRSPNLREERSTSYTTSLDYNSNIDGRPIQVGATYFYTRLSDVFVFEENEDESLGFREFLRVNAEGARVQGVQFDVNWRFTRRMAVRSGVTFQQARFDQPEPQFNSLRFFRTPNSYGFAGIDVDLPGRVDLSSTLDFTGIMLVPHFAGFIPEDRIATSPRFLTWDLIMGKTWDLGASERRQVRLFFRGRNLTDSFQRDFDQGPLRDVGYIYGPLFMRSLALGMTLRF
jgi:outer membrane receptor for ferrienterochelin and colicins